ncbi:MAG: hypothetical protein C5B47_05740 [Verrucomicrobia bacterium]|nr:MAG: hypothetical protein C5B47_05740 [Verrucomicrobiota bacterium]
MLSPSLFPTSVVTPLMASPLEAENAKLVSIQSQAEPPLDELRTQNALMKRQRRALLAFPNRVLHTSPADIPNLDAEIFTHITSAELKLLSLEQIAQLTPQQVTAIPMEILLSLNSQQISKLEPAIFRELPAAYFNRLPFSKSQLHAVQAVTPEQIREIQVCADLVKAFFMALTPAQIHAFREGQIAEIDPEIFRGSSLVRFISNLNQAQLQALTANQIQMIDPKDLQQLLSVLLGQERNLFEELLPIQRRWLTQEQLSIVMALQGKNVVTNCIIDRFQSLPKPGVQKLTQQEIQALTPEMLHHLGLQFLRKLKATQIDWLTSKQRQIFNASDLTHIREEFLQTGISVQERLRGIKQSYLAKLAPDDIVHKSPDFFSKLIESDLSVLSPEQLSKMTQAQISYQKSSFFQHLSAHQIIAFNKTQRQSIAPEIFAELTVENFWEKLPPLHLELNFIAPQYQRFLSPSQFHAILQELTAEQVSRIPVTVYQKMGDNFILSLPQEAFLRIPEAAFKYVTSQLIRRLNQIQIGNFTSAQIVHLKTKAFSAFSHKQISWLNPAVFQAFTKTHIERLAITACSSLQIAQLKPEIFASIPGIDLAQLDPRVFAILGEKHLNALARLPSNRNANGEIISHPIRWLTAAQLKQIPRERISKVGADFFEKLTPEQFKILREVQLRELPIKYISMWKEENNFLYQHLLSKKNLLYADQQIALETSPRRTASGSDRAASFSPIKRIRMENRAIVLFAPQSELETNELIDLQVATESFRARYPNSDVYALGLDRNGQWKQWQFVPGKKWAESWNPVISPPQGEYDKVILLGHGGDPNEIENAHFGVLADEFFKWARNISKINHLSLLVCGTRIDLGMMFMRTQEGPSLGKVPLLNGTQIERITGSELPIYIGKQDADGKPGRRFYQEKTDGKIKRGVKEAKWEIKRNPEGGMAATRYLPSANGDGEIFLEKDHYAGPFGYAERRQRALHAETEVKQYLEAKRAIIKDAEEKAALLDNRSLNKNYVAIIERLRQSAEGEYSLPVIDIQNGEQKNIKIPAEQATDYQARKQKIEPAYQSLKSHIEIQGDGVLKIKPIERGDVGHPGTLNSAFLTKAFFEILNSKKQTLSLAEKLSLYTNLGGMGVAVAADGVELAKLITQMSGIGGTVERSLQNLSGLAGKANSALILMNMGFDIHTLETSKDPLTRTAAGVDLGFNSAALGLQIGPRLIAAAIPEVAEASAGFGSLAVPLMGLGIGFTALGIQIAAHNQKVREFYNYLSTYYKASNEGAYTNKGGILIPAPNIPIEEINLREGKLTMGEVRIQASERAATHASGFAYFIQQTSGAAPDHLYKNGQNQYFNILKTHKQKLDISALAIVLSAVPPTDIGYSYEYTATGKSAEEKQIDRQIQEMGKFAPSNSWGNLRAVTSLRDIRYRTSTQRVLLDQKPRTIILPPKQTDPQTLEKTTFLIEGSGGTYGIRNLYPQNHLILRDQQNTKSTYHLETPEHDLLENSAVTSTSSTLTIQPRNLPHITVDISGLQPGTTLTLIGKNGQIHRTLVIKSQTAVSDERAAFAGPAVITHINTKDLPDFQTILNQKNPNELADLIVIKNGEEPRLLQTLWDTQNRRLITPSANYNLQQQPNPWAALKIIGLTNKHVFFLDTQKQTILQTNRLTNQPIDTYQLRFYSDENFKITTEGQQTYLTQTLTISRDLTITLTHQFKNDCLELVDIRNLDIARFQKFLNFPDSLLANLRDLKNNNHLTTQKRDLLEILASQLQLPAGNEPEEDTILPAQIAEWLRIQGLNNKGKPQTLYLNLKNAYSIPMKLAWTHHLIIAHGWYPPKTGGGWLVLWNPDTQKAFFLTLAPSYFASPPSSAPDDRIPPGTINPMPTFHRLMPGEEEVMPFPNPEGSVILVSIDGKHLSFVDVYGRETITELSLEDEDKLDKTFVSDADLVLESMEERRNLEKTRELPNQPRPQTMLAV